jgi:hypothetical protein
MTYVTSHGTEEATRSGTNCTIISGQVYSWTYNHCCQKSCSKDHGWLCTATTVLGIVLRAAGRSISGKIASAPTTDVVVIHRATARARQKFIRRQRWPGSVNLIVCERSSEEQATAEAQHRVSRLYRHSADLTTATDCDSTYRRDRKSQRDRKGKPMMTPRTFVCLIAGLLSVVSAATAQPFTVVSPAGLGDADGNIRAFPKMPYPQSHGDVPAMTGRFQELHPASAFDSLETGPLMITSLAWRPDVSVNEPISDEWEFALNLSTTNVGTLNLIFAENFGAHGGTEVFSGPVQLQTDGVPRGPGLPHEFDYVVEFDTPFLYFPQEGDLLVDVVFEVPLDDPWIWVDADNRTGEVVEGRPLGPLATNRALGLLVTEFTFVPEPSILLGDLNLDGEINGLDVDPFVDVLLSGPYQIQADINLDAVVNGLDVDPFVAAVVGGVQQIPEPLTLLLAFVALGVVGGRRKWGG